MFTSRAPQTLREDAAPPRRLRDSQLVPRTGMAILDVALLSGFRFPAVAAAPSELIRRVEIRDERVVFYLDSVSNPVPHWVIVKTIRRRKKYYRDHLFFLIFIASFKLKFGE